MQGFIVITILLLNIILGIAYHEYGHMKSALKRGCKVTHFQIGFGPIIWKKTAKSGIEYRIAVLPFGGECGIEGDDLKNLSFKNFSAVLSAGVGRNLLFGIVETILGIIICQLAIGNGFRPIYAIQHSLMQIVSILGMGGELLSSIFNIKEIAQYGGYIGQANTINTIVEKAQITGMQSIGMGLVMGGVLNYTVSVINLIPIPLLDGGQIVVKFFQNVFNKVFKKTIPAKMLSTVNYVTLMIILSYQGMLFLLDIPFVREGVLNKF